MTERSLNAFAVDEEPEQPAEEALKEGEKDGDVEPSLKMPAPAGSDVPDWVVLPSHMPIPRGKQVVFLRILPELTEVPSKGERQCIIWSLTDGEEKLAADRCDGKPSRAPSEYSKQMIRAVDGTMVDWSKPRGPGSIDEFWREIGPKGRNLVMRVYTQLHMASDEELRDFFESCIAVRTAN